MSEPHFGDFMFDRRTGERMTVTVKASSEFGQALCWEHGWFGWRWSSDSGEPEPSRSCPHCEAA